MLNNFALNTSGMLRRLGFARLFALGRALIALGQLSVLITTPVVYLTVPVGGVTHSQVCESYPSWWNLLCSEELAGPARWLYVAILLWVISGLYPRFSGMLHYYISLSLLGGITLPDGGESAAVVVLTWVAIVTLFDGRKSAWSLEPYWTVPLRASMPWWAAVPITASFFLKVQVSLIYAHSAVSKVGTEAWLDGTALYYVMRMEMFGAAGPFSDLALLMTSHPLLVLGLSHGTLVLELAIAVMIWLPGRRSLGALVISSMLHVAIIVLLGISSFGLVMIGAVCLAVAVTPLLRAPCGSATEADNAILRAESKSSNLLPRSGDEVAGAR